MANGDDLERLRQMLNELDEQEESPDLRELQERLRRETGPTTTDDIIRKGVALTSAFSSGFNRGLSQMIGLPVDIVNTMLGAVGVPVSETPVGGGRFAGEIFEDIGFIGPEPRDRSERVASRIGEEIGAAAVPLSAGATAARLGARGTSALGRAFIEPFRTAPARTAALEGISATGGGAGAAAALEAAPDSALTQFLGQAGGGLVAEAAGQLGGSFRPFRQANRAIRQGVEGARDVTRMFSPRSRAERTVREILNDHVSNPQRAVARLMMDPGEVPLTTAQQSQDVGLLSLERQVERGSPLFAGRLSTLSTEQNQILRESFKRLAPDAEPELLERFLRRRVGGIREAAAHRVNRAFQDAAQQVQSLGLPIESQEASRIVREALEDALTDARSGERAAWQAIGGPDGLRIDTQPIKDAVTNWHEGLTQANKLEVPDTALNLIGGFNEQENVIEFLDVLSNLGGKARGARARGEFNEARIISELESVIREQLHSLPITGPEMKKRYDAARAVSLQLNQLFTHGEVGRVLRPSPRGGDVVEPGRSIDLLFKPGVRGGINAQQALQALGGREEAIGAFEDYIRRQFLASVVDQEGKVSARAASRFNERFSDALNEFPEVKEQLGNVFKAQQIADRSLNAQSRTGRQLQHARANLFIDNEPRQAIRAALRGGGRPIEAMTSLVRSANRDSQGHAIKGLQRLFLDEGIHRASEQRFDSFGEAFLDPGALRTFMVTNGDVARKSGLFSDVQWRNIQKLTEEAEIIARRPAGRVSPQVESSDALALNSLLSRAYGIQRGVVSRGFVAGELAARSFNRFMQRISRRQAQALLEDALLNPEVGERLLTVPTPDKAPPTIDALRAHLLNQNLAEPDQFEEEEEEEEFNIPAFAFGGP